MVINGKDRGLLYSVGAFCEISDLCPDGNIENIQQYLTSGSRADSLKAIIKVAIVLNKWHEESLGDGGDTPLQESDFLCVPMKEYANIQMAVMDTIKRDSAVTVEAESEKKRRADK